MRQRYERLGRSHATQAERCRALRHEAAAERQLAEDLREGQRESEQQLQEAEAALAAAAERLGTAQRSARRAWAGVKLLAPSLCVALSALVATQYGWA